MPFVEVEGSYLKPKSTKDVLAADTKNDLLFEPVYGITAVQPSGDAAVFRLVLVDIRIEQKDWYCSGPTAHFMEPGPYPNRSAPDFDANRWGKRAGPSFGYPRIRRTNLFALVIERLQDIAILAGKRNENHRHAEICG
jgi:hypothetical protein